MSASEMVLVEREYDAPRTVVFRAWTDPEQLARWRGSPGWHVEAETVSADLRPGGHHHHVKVLDDDPAVRVATDGVYLEYLDPEVLVSRERITGDAEIDPDVPLELRVEFELTGRGGTLVRIIQGPYEPDVAEWHLEGWERELIRLEAYLTGDGAAETA